MPANRSARVLSVDAHYDGVILREARRDPLDLAIPTPMYHADLDRMRKGGIGVVFAMVGDHNLRQSSRMIDGVYRMCAAHPTKLALCLTADDARRAMRTGRTGIVMTIEGQVMFAEQEEHLRNWRRLGVRLASLTHGEGRWAGKRCALQHDASLFAHIAPETREAARRRMKGLTEFARRSLDTMAELSMPCDLAHTNDRAFWEAIEYARGPLCYTHGACYALCPHARNLTDDMMKALARRGGVMGICFYPPFLSEKTPTLDDAVAHFLHALEVMGEDHVGLGTDYDGMPFTMTPLLDVLELPALWEALARRGVSRTAIAKVARDNFLRLLP